MDGGDRSGTSPLPAGQAAGAVADLLRERRRTIVNQEMREGEEWN